MVHHVHDPDFEYVEPFPAQEAQKKSVLGELSKVYSLIEAACQDGAWHTQIPGQFLNKEKIELLRSQGYNVKAKSKNAEGLVNYEVNWSKHAESTQSPNAEQEGSKPQNTSNSAPEETEPGTNVIMLNDFRSGTVQD